MAINIQKAVLPSHQRITGLLRAGVILNKIHNRFPAYFFSGQFTNEFHVPESMDLMFCIDKVILLTTQAGNTPEFGNVIGGFPFSSVSRTAGSSAPLRKIKFGSCLRRPARFNKCRRSSDQRLFYHGKSRTANFAF